MEEAVFALYGITLLFTLAGVALAAIYLAGVIQGRFVYASFVVLFSFIAAIAIKTARRKQWEAAPMRSAEASPPVESASEPGTSTDTASEPGLE